MKSTLNKGRIAALGFAVILAGTAPALLAYAKDSGQSASSGNGYYGMGPGMMYDNNGYGMGPGMMYGNNGYGMGPGMMGDYGMGPGMMGGLAPGLDLTDAQQAQINKITDDTRKSQWALMGAMLDQQAALRDQYATPKHDNAAVEQSYKNFSQLRQQMFNNMADAQKRIDAVLTKEQREKLHRYWGQDN
jgi:Spy/CpxP family protein refolding chaperone